MFSFVKFVCFELIVPLPLPPCLHSLFAFFVFSLLIKIFFMFILIFICVLFPTYPPCFVLYVPFFVYPIIWLFLSQQHWPIRRFSLSGHKINGMYIVQFINCFVHVFCLFIDSFCCFCFSLNLYVIMWPYGLLAIQEGSDCMWSFSQVPFVISVSTTIVSSLVFLNYILILFNFSVSYPVSSL